MRQTFYVYILRCADGKRYVGYSANLAKRLEYHKRGYVQYTSSRLPIELITFIGFQDKYAAIAFERYLKSGSGIAFMNKRLIHPT